MIKSEQYQSLIELLKQALQFYAKQDNYKSFDGITTSTPISKDNGSQAIFAIKKIDEMNQENKNLMSEYENIVSGLSDDGESYFSKMPKEIVETIESWKVQLSTTNLFKQ